MPKILVVEDEDSIREMYEMVLTSGGFEVETAEDGEEGLKAASKKPDLIFLDIMLPKMNGIDILRNIKQNPATKEIPVIMLTNLGQDSIINEALNLGAQEFLVKVQISPFDLVDKAKQLFGLA
jgi:CheY-like chemotaxis protein